MRAGIVVNVTRADGHRLEAIVLDRSAPQKHVWRANIILATADGCGTAEIMRRSVRFRRLTSMRHTRTSIGEPRRPTFSRSPTRCLARDSGRLGTIARSRVG